MRNQLIAAIDAHFENAPRTAQVQELHDEILQNTLDRYDEELAAGKSEADAFSAAFTAIGDIDALLSPLCPKRKTFPPTRAVAIALYILCVIPTVIGEVFGDIGEAIGTCLMFVMAAVATSLIVWPTGWKATYARKLRAVGIGMYVLCVTPPIFFDEIVGGAAGDALGVSLMFGIVAIATVLVVLSAQRSGKQTAAPASEVQSVAATPTAERQPASPARVICTVLYWIAAACAFSLVGNFVSWFFAWLVFPFAGVLGDIIAGIVLLAKGKAGAYRICRGILGLLILSAYLFLTLHTEKWLVTWLVFPIGGALHGVLSGVFDLVKGGKENEKRNR